MEHNKWVRFATRTGNSACRWGLVGAWWNTSDSLDYRRTEHTQRAGGGEPKWNRRETVVEPQATEKRRWLDSLFSYYYMGGLGVDVVTGWYWNWIGFVSQNQYGSEEHRLGWRLRLRGALQGRVATFRRRVLFIRSFIGCIVGVRCLVSNAVVCNTFQHDTSDMSSILAPIGQLM